MTIYDEPKKIDGSITIIASYNDSIRLAIQDKASGITFVDVELTREQFVNAAMNRLGNTELKSVTVYGLDKLGKEQVHKPLAFEITKYGSAEEARERVLQACPVGWFPDMGFSSQGTFFGKDGKNYAQTTIRTWVEKGCD